MLISTTDNGVVVRNSVIGCHVLWNWIPHEYRPRWQASDHAIRKCHRVYLAPLGCAESRGQIVYISLCAYLWVALAVKSSLTVFIMRIFPTKTIRRIGIGTIIFMVLMTISGELPLILQCNPVRAAYDPPKDGIYTCFTPKTLMNIQLYQAILMFLVDVVIIVMPMPTIWKLQMPVQRRLVIMGLFALGMGNTPTVPSMLYGFETDGYFARLRCMCCRFGTYSSTRLPGEYGGLYQYAIPPPPSSILLECRIDFEFQAPVLSPSS